MIQYTTIGNNVYNIILCKYRKRLNPTRLSYIVEYNLLAKSSNNKRTEKYVENITSPSRRRSIK